MTESLDSLESMLIKPEPDLHVRLMKFSHVAMRGAEVVAASRLLETTVREMGGRRLDAPDGVYFSVQLLDHTRGGRRQQKVEGWDPIREEAVGDHSFPVDEFRARTLLVKPDGTSWLVGMDGVSCVCFEPGAHHIKPVTTETQL